MKNTLFPKASSKLTDLELQQPRAAPQPSHLEDCHTVALHCIFDIPEKQVNEWSGASTCCRFLERSFQPLLADEYASLWPAMGLERPRTVVQCWPWFRTVLSTLRKMDENSSIEDLWNRLQARGVPRPDVQGKSACLLAIFAVLCWGTMALQPKIDWRDLAGIPSLSVCHQLPEHPGLKMDLVRRPISAVFHHLQRTMPISRWRHYIGESQSDVSTTLHVASLNFASLRLIGKIRVAWVDNLSHHLDFDAPSRTLSIFKFPSFCALGALDRSNIPPVFNWSVALPTSGG